MASMLDENLLCPICYEMFNTPVVLTCGHSLCKTCLQTWWTHKTRLVCPLCKGRSLQRDPPTNIVLQNLCEAFQREQSVAVCSLHSEPLDLFCLDHQEPICITCQKSTHDNHRVRPIDEAARDCKQVLQELLPPLREDLKLLVDVRGELKKQAEDNGAQALATVSKIHETYCTLHSLLRKEGTERAAAVQAELRQKNQTIMTESAALGREISDLLQVVRATEEVLRAEDLAFLLRYEAAAQKTQTPRPHVPQPGAGGRVDVDGHLNNLSLRILGSMREEVEQSASESSIPPATVKMSQRRL